MQPQSYDDCPNYTCLPPTAGQPVGLTLRDAENYDDAVVFCSAKGRPLADRTEMAPLQLTLSGEEVW